MNIKKIIKEEITNKSIEEDIKSKIRDVSVKYVDFNGVEQTGVIQVNKRIVTKIKNVFNELYNEGFQINKIEPANGRSDKELIDNNITTAFNYRRAITPNGLGKLSKHAWGLSWDINPRVNPAEPNCGMEFEYGCENGVLNDEDIQMIKSNGFEWGGEIFEGFYDSHHFEVPFTDEEEEIQNNFIINNF
jgi:hypothetical protein